jgi:hypothetical protein
MPTSDESVSLMMDIGWILTAENMAFSVNSGGLQLPEDDFAWIVNCFFYAVEDGRLRTRRIQWIDFFPLTVTSIDDDTEEVNVRLWPDFEHTVGTRRSHGVPAPELV